MGKNDSSSRRLVVDLPADDAATASLDDAALVERLRLLWILDRVRAHDISVGRGAELAGCTVEAFLERMAEHGISPWSYEASEIDRELGALYA